MLVSLEGSTWCGCVVICVALLDDAEREPLKWFFFLPSLFLLEYYGCVVVRQELNVLSFQCCSLLADPGETTADALRLNHCRPMVYLSSWFLNNFLFIVCSLTEEVFWLER